MKNKTELILFSALLGAILGSLLKIIAYKFMGDVLLAISIVCGLLFIYTLVFQGKRV